MTRTTLLLALMLSSSSGCLLEDTDTDNEPLVAADVCVIDDDGTEVCEGSCETGACLVETALPDFDPAPDPDPELEEELEEELAPGMTPIAFTTLEGEALTEKCNKDPGQFPEYPGEVCTDRGGYGRWLMCHSRNAVKRNYRPGCRKCRDNWQWVERRCSSIPKSKPIEKITCLKDAMQNWIGHAPVCDEASRCLMRILDRVGYKCHREASDTHAWVVCNINGVRHVFDGNNGMYYTCRPSTTR